MPVPRPPTKAALPAHPGRRGLAGRHVCPSSRRSPPCRGGRRLRRDRAPAYAVARPVSARPVHGPAAGAAVGSSGGRRSFPAPPGTASAGRAWRERARGRLEAEDALAFLRRGGRRAGAAEGGGRDRTLRPAGRRGAGDAGRRPAGGGCRARWPRCAAILSSRPCLGDLISAQAVVVPEKHVDRLLAVLKDSGYSVDLA